MGGVVPGGGAPDAGHASAMFPVLSPLETSWAPGERQTIEIVPGPRDEGRAMVWTLIDDVSGQVVAQQRFTYHLPVTHLTVEAGAWPTGLYRGSIEPAGAKVDGSVRRLSQKMVSLIVRPAQRPEAKCLFVAPTDMWRAYASNGGHAMTSWRESWHYDSVGYSPTVLNTRFRRSNHYYYGLYERYSDIQHYRYLRELRAAGGMVIDYCTQDDIARGRVRLDDYQAGAGGQSRRVHDHGLLFALPQLPGARRRDDDSRRRLVRGDRGVSSQHRGAPLYLAAGSCVDAPDLFG